MSDPSDSPRRRHRVVLVLALLLSTAAFAALTAHRLGTPNGLYSTDGRYHARYADEILAGGSLERFRHPPGYTITLLTLKAAFGDHFDLACAVLQFLALVVSGLLAGRLVRDRLGPLAGTLTSAAVMLSPHLINQSSKLRPEILTMVLVTLAMPALLRQRRTLRDLLLAAFWLAAACHIRNSVLPFAATVGLWLFLLEPISRFTRRGFRNAAVFSATFLLLLVPWCSFASARVGKPCSSPTTPSTRCAPDPPERADRARRGLAHEKQEDPFAERDEAPERRPPSTMGGLPPPPDPVLRPPLVAASVLRVHLPPRAGSSCSSPCGSRRRDSCWRSCSPRGFLRSRARGRLRLHRPDDHPSS
jgi:hypothetical protein